MLKATKVSCGLSKNGEWRKQTWWWDSSVNDAVKEKKRPWKIWKNGGSKEDYILDLHLIAKQMKQENKDIVGEKCIRNDNDVLAFNEEDKKKAWKQHYERLLNGELPWREEDLSTADPIFGPRLLITKEI